MPRVSRIAAREAAAMPFPRRRRHRRLQIHTLSWTRMIPEKACPNKLTGKVIRALCKNRGAHPAIKPYVRYSIR